jgi:hypothetical protein
MFLRKPAKKIDEKIMSSKHFSKKKNKYIK